VEEAAERATGERTAGGGRLVDEVGFARGGSYRALTYAEDSARRTFLAGRPEFLVERSTRKQGADGDVAWPDEEKAQLQERIEEEAAQGRRVTAYARAQRSDSGEDGSGESEPSDLVFVGAAVIADPIRPEVPDAVAQLEGAGIRVLMVTGDVAATAAHVGREVGLGDGRPVTGGELAGQDEAGYEALVRDRRVFCRTTPEQKLHLVQALVRQGEVVGVTGDGVNDAPALRAGQVGIAMGQTGTDVAREAADLVLTDDNFARLPDGVAIGRKAYDNFSKGLTYYLSAKAILLSIFVVPLAVGVPFPLAPIHIILTELLMDLASSTIFVTEEAEPDLLERPPRQRTGYLSWDVAGRIARNAAGLVIAILAVYFGSRALGYGLDSARTAAFATWLLGHIVLAMNLKQRRRPLLRQGLLANRFAAGWLLGMVALVLVMTLAAPVRAVLKTTPLSGLQWLGVVAGALLASGWMEVRKWLAT
jgi:P-type Ca2+ transporter type 2C